MKFNVNTAKLHTHILSLGKFTFNGNISKTAYAAIDG